jgi:poly(glycerol-phosphate) alpha-glucosyltransferase
MRIAELTRFVSRLDGGIFFALSGLLPKLAETARVELRVFGAADVHTCEDCKRFLPLRVEAFTPWPPMSFGFTPRLLPALRRFNPDALHVHGLWAYPSIASLILHRSRNTPLIVSPHGMLDAWALARSGTRKKIVGRLFQNAQLRAAAVLHALNASEARAFRSYGFNGPIAVIPNGADLPTGPVPAPPWDPSPSVRPRTLLFMGRIHPKKGLDPLVQAWIPFSATAPGKRWRLVIAGWDEIGFETTLRAMVSAAGATDSVLFSGPLWGERKQAAYAAADGFILPSFSEGLPMTVLEAWSYSKPALISSACNLPEGIAVGAALDVSPTVDGIGYALARLARMSDAELHAMGACGRRLVEQRFTWTKLSSDVVRLYQAVAARQPLPLDLQFSDS